MLSDLYNVLNDNPIIIGIIATLMGTAIGAFLLWLKAVFSKKENMLKLELDKVKAESDKTKAELDKVNQNKQKLDDLLKTNGFHVFDNQEAALPDMYEKAVEARRIYVFANYADVFHETNKDMHELMKKFYRKNKDYVRFLVLKKESDVAKEYKKEKEDYIDIMDKAITKLSENNINLRFHEEKSCFRIYIFDDVMYLGLD